MSALMSVASDLVAWLGETAWQVALLVMIVTATQRLLRRWLSPRAQYALWLLVVARLLMPSLPSAPWSVFRLTTAGPAAHAPEHQDTTLGIPPAEVARAREPRTVTAAHDTAAPRAASRRSAAQATPPAARMSPIGSTVAEDAPASAMLTAICSVWLAGVLLLLARIAVLETRFRRRLRAAAACEDPAIQRSLEECARALGVRAPRLLVTRAVAGPALCGMLRPKLLLPPHVLESLSPAELRAVFRHELAHVASCDAALDRLLALLQCVHWFHPAVWFAFRRLREAREAACDAIALCGCDAPARRDYGATVIRLIETCSVDGTAPVVRMSCSRNQMKRRIQMIIHPVGATRRTRALAFASIAVIGLVTLTGASQDPGAAGGDARALRTVRVARCATPSPAETALRHELEKPIALRVQSKRLEDVLDMLRAQTRVDYVLDPESSTDNEELSIELPQMPLHKALDLFCAQSNLEWGLRRGAVLIGERGRARSPVRRIYDIRGLLQPRAPEASDEDCACELIELLHGLVDPEAWEQEHVSVGFWRGALVVTQTEEMHGRVLAFLNRLLNGGRAEGDPADPEQAKLEQVLAARADVRFSGTSLAEVTRFLRSRGAPVIVHADIDSDMTVTLTLNGATLRDVIAHVEALAHVRVSARRGVLHIGESEPLEVRYHDVATLVRTPSADDGDGREPLANLILESLPRIADVDGSRIMFWNDLMLVRNTPTAHAEIAAFLGALQQTLATR